MSRRDPLGWWLDNIASFIRGGIRAMALKRYIVVRRSKHGNIVPSLVNVWKNKEAAEDHKNYHSQYLRDGEKYEVQEIE